jgi:hypothetical protein
LRSQAEIITRYAKAKGRMPPSFERALEWSGKTISNRGDADGRPVAYVRVDDQHYRICASGPRLHIWIDARSIRVDPWPPGKHDPICTGFPIQAGDGGIAPPPPQGQTPAAAFSAAIAGS